nr:biotin synthase BioB [Dethiosulfovibrio faecalis]
MTIMVWDIESLLDLSRGKLKDLLERADSVRRMGGDGIEFCSIVNARSGGCSEDCAFCAQSVRWDTGCRSSFLSLDEVMSIARSCRDSGIHRLSLVTSGRTLTDRDLDRLCGIYEVVSNEVGLSLCGSHGLLDEGQLRRLASAGVSRYHCNLETGPGFFPSICTTHGIEEKLRTLCAARAAGLELCSGGLLGMGETDRDRAEMVALLSGLEVDSIPLNILMPIEGTPLEGAAPVDPETVLRWGAVMQIAVPGATVRYAGGRSLLGEAVSIGLVGGIGGLLTGDYLTTTGSSAKDDVELIESLGMKSGQR